MRKKPETGEGAIGRACGGPTTLGYLRPLGPAFGNVEGGRGAIIHWVMVDDKEEVYRVKISDPSFVN